jgi:hypothetical protein
MIIHHFSFSPGRFIIKKKTDILPLIWMYNILFIELFFAFIVTLTVQDEKEGEKKQKR